ncbi:uncharacterized protein [Diadema antillarum]|uniref:uncharacterized protein n=1 Tax=Diadema antillarum TaxID=105358 RepID=UPI003A84147B
MASTTEAPTSLGQTFVSTQSTSAAMSLLTKSQKTKNKGKKGNRYNENRFLYGTLPISILLVVLIIVVAVRPRKVLRRIRIKRSRRDDANKGSSEGGTTAYYENVNDLEESRTKFSLSPWERSSKTDSLPSIPRGDFGRVDDNRLESEIYVKNPLYFRLEETAERSGSKQAAEAVGKDGEKMDGAVHVDNKKRRGNSNVVVATLHQSPSSTPPPLIVDHLYETVQETFQCKPEDDASVSQSRHESESDITTSPYDRLNRGFVLPVTGQEKPPQPGQPNPTEDEHNDKVSDDLPGKPTLQDSDRHESESDPGTNSPYDRLNEGFVLPVTGQEKNHPNRDNRTQPKTKTTIRHESESDPGTNSPYDRLNEGFVLSVTSQKKPPQPGQQNPTEDERNDKVSDGLPGKPTLQDSDRQSEIHVCSNYTDEEKPMEATDRQSQIHVYSNYTDEEKPLEATDRQSEIHVYSNYTDEGKPLEATDRQSEIHVYSNYTDEGKPLDNLLEATDRQSDIHVYSNYTDEEKPLEATDRQSEIHVYSNYTDEGKPLEATDRQSEIHVYSNYTDEGKPLEATETSANPAYTDK